MYSGGLYTEPPRCHSLEGSVSWYLTRFLLGIGRTHFRIGHGVVHILVDVNQVVLASILGDQETRLHKRSADQGVATFRLDLLPYNRQPQCDESNFKCPTCVRHVRYVGKCPT